MARAAQVRSVGTWAGNLILTQTHPQFGSDVATIFATAGVTVSTGSAAGVSKTGVTVPELLAYTQDTMRNLVG